MRQVCIMLALCVCFSSYASSTLSLQQKIDNLASPIGPIFQFLQKQTAVRILDRNNISIQNINLDNKRESFSNTLAEAYNEALKNIETIKLDQDDYKLLQDKRLHPIYQILSKVFLLMLDQKLLHALQSNNLFEEFFYGYIKEATNIIRNLLIDINRYHNELLQDNTGITNAVNNGIKDILFQSKNISEHINERATQKQIKEFWEAIFEVIPTNLYHENSLFIEIIFEYNRARYPEMFVAPMLQEIIENSTSEDISQDKAAQYVWHLLNFESYADQLPDESNKRKMTQHHLNNINMLLEKLLNKQSVYPENISSGGSLELTIADSLGTLEKQIQAQDIKQEAFAILKTLNKHGLLKKDEVERWTHKSDLLQQYYEQYFNIQENIKQVYNALETLQAHIPKSK